VSAGAVDHSRIFQRQKGPIAHQEGKGGEFSTGCYVRSEILPFGPPRFFERTGAKISPRPYPPMDNSQLLFH